VGPARPVLLLAALVALIAPLGCDYAAIQLHFNGALVVYVYDADFAIQSTLIEVVETGGKATTNSSAAAGTSTRRSGGCR